MIRVRLFVALLTVVSSAALPACRSSRVTPSTAASNTRISSEATPAVLRPPGGTDAPDNGERPPQILIDLSDADAVVWGTTPAEVFDTRNMPQFQLQTTEAAEQRRVKEILPEHHHDAPLALGPANDLPVGGVLEETRAAARQNFPGIGATGWVPPDPTLAVGPNHIVTTVNMAISFYAKDGTLQYSNQLNDTGNPGFFETVGAGGFTFDPKCFYDHLAERFVVVAPEVYGETEAWITIAVSDDSDPHGVWYKYRTDAVITVGSATFWWDYPGFGYDADAYYVTSNLFGLNQGGWAGVGFRIFDKASMLSGDPVSFATLRDGGAASVQVAQHFGPNPAPYFVSTYNSAALRIHAIRDPLTSPTLVSTTVGVPSYGAPTGAPAAGGNEVSLVDSRIMNAHWRDGELYACHNINNGSRNVARWYHLATNNWPDSGAVTFVESGNVLNGVGVHTWFPAIYTNAFGEVAMVVGASSSSERISINVTGRTPADPPGTMGSLTQVKLAPVDGGGRWGDYYDIALDPSDNRTFWVIGEHPSASGWSTWIDSFQVTDGSAPTAAPDDFGIVAAGDGITIDVLGNDVHTGGLAFGISDFDAASVHGGAIALSAGTGPGGRDQLVYTAPLAYTGADSFNYTVEDTAGGTATVAVSGEVVDPSEFRTADNPGNDVPGFDATYYLVNGLSQLPNFSFAQSYATEIVAQVNYPQTAGEFAGSERWDNVAAVFEGFITVPLSAVYTFHLTSDDGSRLLIGTQEVVDNDGLHGMTEASGGIGLLAGAHALRIEFFENGGDCGLIAEIEGGTLGRQIIPAVMLTHVTCTGDVNGDGLVNLTDLARLLSNFDMTPAATGDGDIDGDGAVGLTDLALLLANFDVVCP